MRWPKGPPHLAPKPSFFVFCCCCFFLAFLSLLLVEKACFSPWKGAFLLICLCLPLLLFSPFLASHFSLSLYLPVSCPFLSSFLAVSHVSFWVLLFVFVLFAFSFELLFCFCCSVCDFALFGITILDIYIYIFFFLGGGGFASCFIVVFRVSYFDILLFFDFWLPIKNISQKIWKFQKPKNEKCRKTDILTRAVRTVVFTNSVFFSFLCFFKFCIFAESWKHYKNRGFSPQKEQQQKNKFLKLKTGPS